MNYYNEIKEQIINNEIIKRAKDYSKNRSDLNTYYNIGKLLVVAGKHYGEGIIKEYSIKLTKELQKNYSVRVLYKMVKYYNFASNQKLPTLSAQLSWSHYDELLKFSDINKINYYIFISCQQNLSIRELREKIKSKEYERLSDETKNKLIEKGITDVKDLIKNPIVIKNSNNHEIISEKVLQRLVLEDILFF